MPSDDFSRVISGNIGCLSLIAWKESHQHLFLWVQNSVVQVVLPLAVAGGALFGSLGQLDLLNFQGNL